MNFVVTVTVEDGKLNYKITGPDKVKMLAVRDALVAIAKQVAEDALRAMELDFTKKEEADAGS